MGRPLNKRVFGDPAVDAGNQLYIQADIGAGEELCFIESQSGTAKFHVVADSGGATGVIFLVNGTAAVDGPGKGYLVAEEIGADSVVISVAIADGGTGYDVADVLTVVGGTGTVATLRVTSESGNVIDGIEILTGGSYSVVPGNPVSVTDTGNSDATFNLTYSVVGTGGNVSKISSGLVSVYGGTSQRSYTINDEDTTKALTLSGT